MIKFLWLLIALTFLMSVFNWYQEQYFYGFFFTNLGAVSGAIISTAAYWVSSRQRRLPTLAFGISAAITTGLSFGLYLYYAINGKAENSSESAAQMHTLLTPAALTAIAIFSLLLSIAISITNKHVKNRIAKNRH